MSDHKAIDVGDLLAPVLKIRKSHPRQYRKAMEALRELTKGYPGAVFLTPESAAEKQAVAVLRWVEVPHE